MSSASASAASTGNDIRRLSNASLSCAPLISACRNGEERLAELMQFRDTSEVKTLLQNRGVPNDHELWTANSAQKLDALSKLPNAYLPTDESLTFTELLLAKVRNALFSKNFADQRYREFFYATRDALHGGNLRPLPANLSSLTGVGISLCGPSQMGRTALLQRIRTILKSPFQVELESPGPAMMWVIPCLNLSYPSCGTLNGLLRDLRDKVVSEVGRANTPVGVFSELRGPEGINAAISLCILMNVALVVVDGACAESTMTGKPLEVLGFLQKLQQYSGIPVVLSGTSPFMHVAGMAGSTSSNLLCGPSLNFDPLPQPSSSATASASQAERKGIWHQMNEWLWTLGLFSNEIKMPDELPQWTHRLTIGRPGWLVQGFEALHVELVKKPHLLGPGKLTEDVVRRVFEVRLRVHAGARLVATECAINGDVSDKTDFFNYMDHLPAALFRRTGYKQWLHEFAR